MKTVKKIFAEKVRVAVVFLRRAGLAMGRWAWTTGSKLAGRAWRLFLRVAAWALRRTRELSSKAWAALLGATPKVARWLVIALRATVRGFVAEIVAGFALGIILAKETIRLAVWLLGIPIRPLLWLYRKDPVFISSLIKGLAATVVGLLVFPGLPMLMMGWSRQEILLVLGLFSLLALPFGTPGMAIAFLPEEELIPKNNHATT